MNTATEPKEPAEPKWWSAAWVKIAAVVIFLVVAFYVGSDWLGALAWEKAKADIAAAGESLDPQKLIPPPVPDDKNFGALPIFEMTPDSVNPRSLRALNMETALAAVSPLPSSSADAQARLLYLGIWEKGEKADLPAIEKKLIELCNKQAGVHLPPQATPAELFGRLCPALADLRAANLTHPACRFDLNYGVRPAMFISLSGPMSIIKLAHALSYEERLALLGHQPDLALDDLKVGWKINSGLAQEPLLVSGLVSCALVAIQLTIVNEGLDEHVWNDEQLTELDSDLGKIDLLAQCQLSMHGEAVIMGISDADFFKHHRGSIQTMLLGMKWSTGTLSGDFWIFFCRVH